MVRADAKQGEAEPLVDAGRIPIDTTAQGGILARCSLGRGRAMSPGIQKSSFYWRDIVHGPPPRRREKGDSLHVTFHNTDDSGDVRIHFTTVVRVDPGLDKLDAADDIIHVEERLNVQRRFLQEWIDRERHFTDRMAMRARSRLAHSLVAQRRFATTLHIAWVASLLIWWIRVQAKVGNAIIRGTRLVMRSLVAIPDAILTHTANAGIHLGSRTGRRVLRKAIRDPASATPHEKVLALVVGSLAIAATILLTDFVIAQFFGQARWAPGLFHVQGDFIKSLFAVLALPFPVELLLIASVLAIGGALAFIGLFVGKMVGSWMLYLMGDSLFDSINKKTKTSPKLKRSVDWLQRNANKYGFWMLIAINAIPFVPDMLIIVFAVSGMRFRGFLWGIGIGTAIKFGGIVAAVYLIGPETVSAFFENPIATLRGS